MAVRCRHPDRVASSACPLSQASFGTLAERLTLPASLSRIGRSAAILGAAAEQNQQPRLTKATHPARSIGRCRSMATTSATTAFFFLQLLGFSSAEEFDIQESPSSSSILSVLAMILAAGFVVFGEAHWFPCDPFSVSVSALSLPCCALLPSPGLHLPRCILICIRGWAR